MPVFFLMLTLWTTVNWAWFAPIIVLSIALPPIYLLRRHIARTAAGLERTGRAMMTKDECVSIASLADTKFVLYLRSFHDDASMAQVQIDPTRWLMIPTPGFREHTQYSAEELVAMALRVAIGRTVCAEIPESSGKPLRLPGAIRMRLTGDWRAEVIALMATAKIVVINVGSGENLLWELQEAIKRVRPEKLVLMLPKVVEDSDADAIIEALEGHWYIQEVLGIG